MQSRCAMHATQPLWGDGIATHAHALFGSNSTLLLGRSTEGQPVPACLIAFSPSLISDRRDII